jgi:hypothetical protein
MGMTNIEENQRAYVYKLLQILSEKKSPSAFSNLSCHLADIQYLQHVDNQTSRLCLIGHEDSDIPQLMKMLASPRPDGQQRVIYLDISGDLKKEMLKAIKKVYRKCEEKKVYLFRNSAPPPNLCHNHFISISMGTIWIFQTVRS